MSSSKVFKQDSLFTPTTLVRHNIVLPREEERPPAAAAVVEEVVAEEAAAQETLPGSELPELPSEVWDEPAAANTPEPESMPTAAPVPEPEPAEPAIDIDAIRQEAYNRGMADVAGQLKMELHQAISAFAEGCQKIDSQHKTMFHRNRAELINLVIMLTEKILRHELTTPRNVIAATLEAALEQAIESEEFYVTLHPDDLAIAEAKVPELIASVRGLSRLVFKTDPSMSRGGCLLESPTCAVDASIELQLESTKEFLEQQPVFVPPADDEPAPASGAVAGETPAGA
ncbi:MAG: flagellar assembly protein FliH [Desulfobulbus sp.]|jgi:flagellar assembly protein FliH|uniref:FliH/SctL family protein n=1 Tax=Desulfobulbus sp. TaxID=895 RepID=UPI002841860F|nr:FliH/SctL family protein [Desulfobulbus sp.]MDR2550770.1 flagellar assembly protein FliH [Desulfobulbus sp.]